MYIIAQLHEKASLHVYATEGIMQFWNTLGPGVKCRGYFNKFPLSHFSKK
jgi:hypothetical protein